MLRTQQPLGKAEPVARQFAGHGGQDRRGGRRYPVAPLVVGSPQQQIGFGFTFLFLHHMSHRTAGADAGFFLLQFREVLFQLQGRLIQREQIPVEDALQFLLAAFAGWFGDNFGELRGTGERSDLAVRELPVIQPDILEDNPIRARAFLALPQFERGVALQAVLQAIDIDLQRLKRPVHINRHPARLAGTIVGDKDMLPDIGRERFFGDHFDGVRWPFADEMGTDPAVFQIKIPAPEITAFVHAGEDGAGGAVFGHPDPGSEGEGFVPFKSIVAGEFHGRPRGDAVAISTNWAGQCGDACRSRSSERPRRGVCGHGLPCGFLQGDLQGEVAGALLRLEIIRRGFGQPGVEFRTGQLLTLLHLFLRPGQFSRQGVPARLV